MYAHYYATRINKFLIITNDIEMRNVVCQVKVSGKTEAKKIAKQKSAKPWNF